MSHERTDTGQSVTPAAGTAGKMHGTVYRGSGGYRGNNGSAEAAAVGNTETGQSQGGGRLCETPRSAGAGIRHDCRAGRGGTGKTGGRR